MRDDRASARAVPLASARVRIVKALPCRPCVHEQGGSGPHTPTDLAPEPRHAGWFTRGSVNPGTCLPDSMMDTPAALAALSTAEIAQFKREGFLIKRNVLSPKLLVSLSLMFLRCYLQRQPRR